MSKTWRRAKGGTNGDYDSDDKYESVRQIEESRYRRALDKTRYDVEDSVDVGESKSQKPRFNSR